MESVERISISDLRALIGQTETGERKRERFPSARIPSGVPRGALVEVTGSARTEWAAAFLAENGGVPVAWVEAQLSIFPTALAERRAGLERIVFIEAGRELDWTLLTLLRSQVFPVIVASDILRGESELRRYQLLAEKANATLLLLSERFTPAWCIALQIEAGRKAQATEIRLRKQKI